MIFLCRNATLSVINFSGNTYAQTNGGVILRDDTKDGGYKRFYYDQNAEQTIKQLTGDITVKVLPATPANHGE